MSTMPLPQQSKSTARLQSQRPALQLVSTKRLDRVQWLAIRKQGIGSSDAAAAVGLNPYYSPLELWMVKTGRDQALPQVDPNDDSSPLYWGTLLEAVVASHYSKRTGNKVRRINAVLRHPELPWMLANIDREVVGSDEVSLLECKTAGMNGAKLWREGVPEYVQLQVQHQLAVTGKAAADVAVLICGQELRIHRIDRDQGLIDSLIRLEAAFWHFVETDTPPPADGSESAELALRCLYPQDLGTTLDFTQDRTLSATFADWINVRATLAEQEKVEAQLKQTLQQAMGDASRAVFETGEVSWKKSKDGTTIDLPRLLQDHPALATQYRISKPGSRRFIVL
ncbi:YqaJ viral recombinase family protein [Denitratisoma oestradiolicum]|uniref:Alkaline phosphatase n=1 Tax=Denitratisoma oestradiolicum TaxID=311182 RepID=A0A6S6XUA4_9PROT|nr:YqaJ viral recombinase family protein [Denitratisoma oestradiolicum]TWO79839.1 hypothetical protein CBW56_13055 [Denitratisoma oestradiolicum]CAB1369535.1 Alkaline phosphatase [Denitratisoma oestradiolicum]